MKLLIILSLVAYCTARPREQQQFGEPLVQEEVYNHGAQPALAGEVHNEHLESVYNPSVDRSTYEEGQAASDDVNEHQYHSDFVAVVSESNDNQERPVRNTEEHYVVPIGGEVPQYQEYEADSFSNNNDEYSSRNQPLDYENSFDFGESSHIHPLVPSSDNDYVQVNYRDENTGYEQTYEEQPESVASAVSYDGIDYERPVRDAKEQNEQAEIRPLVQKPSLSDYNSESSSDSEGYDILSRNEEGNTDNQNENPIYAVPASSATETDERPVRNTDEQTDFVAPHPSVHEQPVNSDYSSSHAASLATQFQEFSAKNEAGDQDVFHNDEHQFENPPYVAPAGSVPDTDERQIDPVVYDPSVDEQPMGDQENADVDEYLSVSETGIHERRVRSTNEQDNPALEDTPSIIHEENTAAEEQHSAEKDSQEITNKNEDISEESSNADKDQQGANPLIVFAIPTSQENDERPVRNANNENPVAFHTSAGEHLMKPDYSQTATSDSENEELSDRNTEGDQEGVNIEEHSYENPLYVVPAVSFSETNERPVRNTDEQANPGVDDSSVQEQPINQDYSNSHATPLGDENHDFSVRNEEEQQEVFNVDGQQYENPTYVGLSDSVPDTDERPVRNADEQAVRNEEGQQEVFNVDGQQYENPTYVGLSDPVPDTDERPVRNTDEQADHIAYNPSVEEQPINADHSYSHAVTSDGENQYFSSKNEEQSHVDEHQYENPLYAVPAPSVPETDERPVRNTEELTDQYSSSVGEQPVNPNFSYSHGETTNTQDQDFVKQK